MLTKLDDDDKLVDIFHAPHIEEEEEFDIEMSEDSDIAIKDSLEDTVVSYNEENNAEEE